jgi:hypothetical protein
MFDARSIGVTRIVAPMIESQYALKKYLQATHLVFPADEWGSMDFLINVETIQAVKIFDEMLKLPTISELKGVVLGRVDMTGSMGLSRENINDDTVFNIAKEVFTKARKVNMECVIGGGVSAYSLPFFRRLPENATLDFYETRKVIFRCPEALSDNADKGILKAVGFELMWLKNKRDFYKQIFEEDLVRIEMLEKRYEKLIQDAGGSAG